jgi:hypothetical protein
MQSHKIIEIFLIFAELAVSQEEIISMELVRTPVKKQRQ